MITPAIERDSHPVSGGAARGIEGGVLSPIPKRGMKSSRRAHPANILDWHRREAKAVWWELFGLSDLSAEYLQDERAGLSGLTFVGVAGGTVNAVHRYTFRRKRRSFAAGERPDTEAVAPRCGAAEPRALSR